MAELEQRMISMIDSGIMALDEKLNQKNRRISALESELAELREAVNNYLELYIELRREYYEGTVTSHKECKKRLDQAESALRALIGQTKAA